MPLGTDAHRRLAIELFNHTWELMEAGDPLMIRTAYASHYHWSKAGGAVQEQRGEWLLSRMWTVIGESGPALRHARRAWELGEACEWGIATGFAEFDRPFALEALARAHAAAGDPDAARDYRAQAQEAGAAMVDEEEREHFLADLAAGNWFALA